MGPNGVCSRSHLRRPQDPRRAHRADQRVTAAAHCYITRAGERARDGGGGQDGTAGVQLRERGGGAGGGGVWHLILGI